MAYEGGDPTCLVGEQLNMVCFVMDYVEVRFNGPTLRALTPPIVSFSDRMWTFVIALREDARVGREAAHYVPARADGGLRVMNMIVY